MSSLGNPTGSWETDFRTIRWMASRVPLWSGMLSHPGGGTRLNPLGTRADSTSMVLSGRGTAVPNLLCDRGRADQRGEQRTSDDSRPEGAEQAGHQKCPTHGEVTRQ